jgi:hypothetical protein
MGPGWLLGCVMNRSMRLPVGDVPLAQPKIALFVRGREPYATRAFRTWGYPVTPALYVVVSALILLNGCVSRPLPIGAGLLVMGAGMPIYWWFNRRSYA